MIIEGHQHMSNIDWINKTRKQQHNEPSHGPRQKLNQIMFDEILTNA